MYHPFSKADLSKVRVAIASSEKLFGSDLHWSFSSFWWPVLWTHNTVGHLWVSRILGLKISFKRQIGIYLANFRALFFGTSPIVSIPPNITQKKYLVHTWVLSGAVDEFLVGRDRYFGNFTTFDADEVTFLVELLSNEMIEAKRLTEKGHIVITRQSDWKRPLKALKSLLMNWAKNPLRVPFYCMDAVFLDGEIISEQIFDIFSSAPPKIFLTPYEAQPIQQRLVHELRVHCGAFTVGYIHSSLNCFPSYMVRRPGAPDLLWVHGSAYKDVLIDCLGWDKNQVKIIDALRFLSPRDDMSSKIYLPYAYRSADVLVSYMSAALSEINRLAPNSCWEICPHPVVAKCQGQFASEVKRLVTENCADSHAVQPTQMAVQLGVSGAILECLESGNQVIHVVEDVRTEVFNSDIWPDICATKLDSNTYHYKLINSGAFVKYRSDQYGSFLTLLADLLGSREGRLQTKLST